MTDLLCFRPVNGPNAAFQRATSEAAQNRRRGDSLLGWPARRGHEPPVFREAVILGPVVQPHVQPGDAPHRPWSARPACPVSRACTAGATSPTGRAAAASGAVRTKAAEVPVRRGVGHPGTQHDQERRPAQVGEFDHPRLRPASEVVGEGRRGRGGVQPRVVQQDKLEGPDRRRGGDRRRLPSGRRRTGRRASSPLNCTEGRAASPCQPRRASAKVAGRVPSLMVNRRPRPPARSSESIRHTSIRRCRGPGTRRRSRCPSATRRSGLRRVSGRGRWLNP